MEVQYETTFTPPDGMYVAILNSITRHTLTKNCALEDSYEERLVLNHLNLFHLEGHQPPWENLMHTKAYDCELARYGVMMAEIFGYDDRNFNVFEQENVVCPSFNLRKKGTEVFYIDCFIENSEEDDYRYRTPYIEGNENSDDCDFHVEAIVVGPYEPDDSDWIAFINDSSDDSLSFFASNENLLVVHSCCINGIFHISETVIE